VRYDDETLMAYADGELDAAQSAALAVAVENDPGLARRVERHRALRSEVAEAFASVLDQPVPERLINALNGGASPAAQKRGEVLQFPERAARAPGRSWGRREWGAMAASVALGALIAWKLFAPAEPNLVAQNGTLVARGALASALERQLASTQSRDSAVLIGVTFKAREGYYCRSFTLRSAGTAGLACRIGSEWQVPVTAAGQVAGDGLQQAASMPRVVLDAIEARAAGEALDATGEANAQLGGWQPQR